MPENQPSWKVKSNTFNFVIDETRFESVSLVQKSPTEYNCIVDHRSVNALIVFDDIAAKKITVEIEGEIFEIEIKDSLGLMLDEMGFSAALTRQIKEVKAPMPGMVLDITVNEGQEVKEGDKLLILSAMKMENSITIAGDAVIKKIAVKQGHAVEKGQVLIELE
jgi:biotin carboxyl carrier protein